MDERKDFTWDEMTFPDLPDFITQMHTHGVRVVTILVRMLVKVRVKAIVKIKVNHHSPEYRYDVKVNVSQLLFYHISI